MSAKLLFQVLILLLVMAIFVIILIAKKISIRSMMTNDKKTVNLVELIALLIFIAVFLAFMIANN